MRPETAVDAGELLKRAFGDDATFHDGQLEAIAALVDDRARVLVVQRTGWGKSVVYFIATALLRTRGSGPTILISPLLSLMRDQLRMAERLGVRAERIDSTNIADRDRIEAALAQDEVDVLLISPERLANERFRTTTIRAIRQGIGLFVVDEAHCISDWGHDFRPDYRRIDGLVRQLPPNVPLLATTATANARVQADIEMQLGPDLRVVRGSLDRDSLRLQVIVLDDQAQRLAWIADYLQDVDGSGIVYTLTVFDAVRVAAWLAEQGIDARAYHGQLSDDERRALEQRLHDGEITALVATVALGMGFDKPDLRFVVHFQRPGSVVAYYQQIGRAGRQLPRADAILLAGTEDDVIADFFINTAFPPESDLHAVLGEVAARDEVRLGELGAQLNLSRGAIEKALKLLELDGAVASVDGHWTRTPNAWEPDLARMARVTATRERERAQMQAFVATDRCLMRFITEELDDPASADCGRCANCAGPFAATRPGAERLQAAIRFLKRAYRPIAPRERWPSRLGLPSTRIPAELQLHEGRALCMYGDGGWGDLVKDGKYGQGSFADELVDAVVEMLADWQPDPMPTWVTSVPSSRTNELVPDFARRLAERLGLPHRAALTKVRETPQQKTMQNSFQQAQNVLGAFEAVAGEVLDGAVLLVDDMVDSRWSLTVCGIALAEVGSGPVIPLALAQTTTGAQP
jgi:ATP-dependent DNA helicase RecQ